MNKFTTALVATTCTLALGGVAGCSDEAKEKWKEAGNAAVEATKETADDVKEGSKELYEKAKEETKELTSKAKEVMQQAEATDPDTGEVKGTGTD